MSEDRLNELECKIAYLESQNSEMSDVLHAQWKEIDLLKRKIVRAESKIESLEHSRSDSDDTAGMSSIEIAALDKPPHY